MIDTMKAPYLMQVDKACPATHKHCWSLSFCAIYGCAKHESNVEERQRHAEDRRLGYTA